MRFSTIASLLIAIILAGGAVFGAQTWLSTERQQLIASFQQQLAAQQGAPAVEEEPKETIVVAAESIQFGERLSVTSVREIEWSGEIRPDGSYRTIAELITGDTEDEARFAVTSMTPGEPILANKITEPGQRAKLSTALTPGMQAVSIRVNDVLGVAGFVLPGDRVNVWLLRDGINDPLLQGVKVLAIDQLSDERADNPSVVRTVTFEVNSTEAGKLMLGGSVGTLSLSLRNVASTDIEQIQRITVDDLTDFDVADDIIEANIEQMEDDAADERIASLEQMFRDLSSGLDDKIQSLATDEVEPVVEETLILPTLPVRSTVGVIRNGQRNEYKVDASSDDEAMALEEQLALE